jgi:hypothetical protein
MNTGSKHRHIRQARRLACVAAVVVLCGAAGVAALVWTGFFEGDESPRRKGPPAEARLNAPPSGLESLRPGDRIISIEGPFPSDVRNGSLTPGEDGLIEIRPPGVQPVEKFNVVE